MTAEARQAGALVSRIDEEMAWVVDLIDRQLINEIFKTADISSPKQVDVPLDGPSALDSLAFLIVSIGGSWGGLEAFRKYSVRRPAPKRSKRRNYRLCSVQASVGPKLHSKMPH